MSIERGAALVKKWAPRFGLGEFRLRVSAIPMDNPDAWARSYYDCHEMWGVVELPPDEFFPLETLELLVLHELAHGLLKLAGADADHNTTEQTCNRIARLTRGDYDSPLMNEQREAVEGEAWWTEADNEKKAASRVDKGKWLTVVADGLPEKEREVISMLYYEGVSLREVASRLGVDVHTVFRWRDKALARMGRYFDALDARYSTARKLIELRMPEGGAEHPTVYETHHRCSPANALVREMGEDIDLLVFPVGNVGYGMPRNVVFAVEALEPCQACGRLLTAQFVWRKGHVGYAGTLWTPDHG